MSALGGVVSSWLLVHSKTQNVLAHNDERRTNHQLGFSLVEVLVALGIIAVLGAVAVPNLRNFSLNQEIDTTSAQIANVLKTAQSSAISRIKCPNGDTTSTYTVRLTPNNYSLIAKCDLSGDQMIDTYFYAPQGADKSIFTGSVDVCQGSTTDIVFTKSKITYFCFGSSAPLTGNVNLKLKNAADTLCKKVKVEQGGVIKVEEGYVCS